MSTILPEHLLRLTTPEVRASLGKAGLLATECREIAMAKSEKALQAQIEAMLRRSGVLWPIRQRMDRKSNVAVGTPDLLFVVTPTNGVPVAAAWEIKMPGEKPSPEQLDAMLAMTRDGWRCAVIHSYDEALGLYNALLAPGGSR